jgi:hypothetical protein
VYSAHFRRGKEYIIRFFFFKKFFSFRLTGKIKLWIALGNNIGISTGFKPPQKGGTNKACMPCKKYFILFIQNNFLF